MKHDSWTRELKQARLQIFAPLEDFKTFTLDEILVPSFVLLGLVGEGGAKIIWR